MNRLRRAGILGINERNRGFIQRWNPRRLYPLVDDKLRTKALCDRHGLATPKLLGSVGHSGELSRLEIIRELDSFVLKPAHGAMGNGILVVRERRDERFVQAGGRELRYEDVRFHALEILAGLYALGGQEDQVVIEECLQVHPDLARISYGGVPDLRILVYRGVPAMAMLRLPTRQSRGRANLHQGAAGVGVSLRSGETVSAVIGTRPTEIHPDTGEALLGVPVPGFRRATEHAVQASDATGLAYLGVDIVVDRDRGPLLLELNARPGLAIQAANRAGLRPRLAAIDRMWAPDLSPEQRVASAAQIEPQFSL